jgi:hypothetical protein
LIFLPLHPLPFGLPPPLHRKWPEDSSGAAPAVSRVESVPHRRESELDLRNRPLGHGRVASPFGERHERDTLIALAHGQASGARSRVNGVSPA